MSDIVERLLEQVDYLPREVRQEAAEEIKRLRAALQKIADLVDSEADEPLDDAIAIARRSGIGK